jgi:hypothetical protein
VQQSPLDNFDYLIVPKVLIKSGLFNETVRFIDNQDIVGIGVGLIERVGTNKK